MGDRALLHVLLAVALASAGCSPSTTTDADAGVDASTEPCSIDRDCDDGVFCNGEERCAPGDGADARGCVRVTTSPCMPSQRCDEDADECANDCPVEPDADGDGSIATACGGDDCDDASARVFPGAMEICDLEDRDDDCDPTTFGVRDGDMDSYADASCCNGERCGTDCDDASAGVHPGLAETCDGRDNDCDGERDEGVVPTWYPDADGDGYGDASATPETTRAECLHPGEGWAATRDDCDDARDDVHPGLPELCNGIDDNCRDGVSDEMGCTCTLAMSPRGCGTDTGACVAGTQRCISGEWGPCEGEVTSSTEACDATRPGTGADEDCDGATDEGLTIGSCYVDADSDSWGEAAAGTRCAGAGGVCPTGTTSRGGDCAPVGAGVYPGATETCDRVDQDCDGRTDEGLSVRRDSFPIADIACEAWQYGRDLSCEGRVANACSRLVGPTGCPYSTGFISEPGGVIHATCLTPGLLGTVNHWELTARHSGCDGSAGEYNACQAAAHRYCTESWLSAHGGPFVSGWTMNVPGVGMYIACLTSAQAEVRSTTWAELTSYVTELSGECDSAPRDGYWCGRAVDRYCRALGFASGFGPAEYSGTAAVVTCIRGY